MLSTMYVEMVPGVTTEDLYQNLKTFYEVCQYLSCSDPLVLSVHL